MGVTMARCRRAGARGQGVAEEGGSARLARVVRKSFRMVLDTADQVSYPDRMEVTRMKFAGLIALTIGAFGLVSTCQGETYSCQSGSHIVQPGDTIWSLVEKRCTGDLRTATYEVRKASDIDGTIYPGDLVVFP